MKRYGVTNLLYYAIIFSFIFQLGELSIPATAASESTPSVKATGSSTPTKQAADNSITFVYGDREVAVAGCQPAWGLIILLSFDGKRILFNIGGEENVLANNLKVLGIPPASIDAVVLSHIHWEMVAAIDYFLKNNKSAPIYVTSEILAELQSHELCKGRLIQVTSPLNITPNIVLLNLKSKPRRGGPFGIEEIQIIARTTEGLAILIGCGHPEVVNQVEKSIAHTTESRVSLLAGGFHLLPPGKVVNLPHGGGAFVIPSLNYSKNELVSIVDKVKELGVKKVIPTHCTGQEAEEIFKSKFKDDYIYQKLGQTFPLPAPFSAK